MSRGRGRPATTTYLFNGEQVTANKVKRSGIIYSVESIRAALEAGCSTTTELVNHIERATAEGNATAYRKGAKHFGKAQFGLGAEREEGA